jgi:RNA polymerase-binding transcription factor DksA
MNKDFTQRQKELIEGEIQSLEGRVGELAEEAAKQGVRNEESEMGPAEDLLADVSERIDDREMAKNELTEALRQYKRALDRIDQGVYGVCERCGKPISEMRLAASPTATLCIDCQRESEKE